MPAPALTPPVVPAQAGGAPGDALGQGHDRHVGIFGIVDVVVRALVDTPSSRAVGRGGRRTTRPVIHTSVRRLGSREAAPRCAARPHTAEIIFSSPFLIKDKFRGKSCTSYTIEITKNTHKRLNKSLLENIPPSFYASEFNYHKNIVSIRMARPLPKFKYLQYFRARMDEERDRKWTCQMVGLDCGGGASVVHV